MDPITNSRKSETRATGDDEVAALKACVARLEAEMESMKSLLERIRSQLGIS